MIKTKSSGKNNGVVGYHAERPSQNQPVVESEYTDADGVRMYQCADGREFIADVYDRLWKAPKGLVKPKNYKGSNATYKRGTHL